MRYPYSLLGGHRHTLLLSFALSVTVFTLSLSQVEGIVRFGEDPRSAYTVVVSGREIGVVKTPEYLASVLAILLPSCGGCEPMGEAYGIGPWPSNLPPNPQITDWIELRPASITGNVFSAHRALRERLHEFLNSHESGFAITVNDREIITLPTASDADHVVQAVIGRFRPQPGPREQIRELVVEPIEAVKIAPTLVPRLNVVSAEDGERFLLNGTVERRSYTVAGGDRVWNIARDHSMSVEEVQKANPGINLERIYPGDVLNLVVPQPYIAIRSTYIREREVNIRYPVSVSYDDTLYRTVSFVQRPGRVGSKRITDRVEMINGEIKSTIVIEEIVLRPPTRQYVRRGTRRTPEDVLGEHVLGGEPLLSSPYGSRWGRMHGGVDWSVPVGTPVKSYREGTVRFAAYHPRYGYLVIMDHPGGLVTYYAHNSHLLVTKGQSVGQGHMIARSGNTGQSTGPHLHFEVHIGGRRQDPLAYLKDSRI